MGTKNWKWNTVIVKKKKKHGWDCLYNSMHVPRVTNGLSSFSSSSFRLLYSLAFNTEFIRNLWQACTSVSMQTVTGWGHWQSFAQRNLSVNPSGHLPLVQPSAFITRLSLKRFWHLAPAHALYLFSKLSLKRCWHLALVHLLDLPSVYPWRGTGRDGNPRKLGREGVCTEHCTLTTWTCLL